MPEEGFEIYDRFYPSPKRFRLGDPVLVREVTGMSWPEFARGLDAMADDYAALLEQGREDEYEPDQVLLVGLMAVAFWQGNKQMSRAKVVRAVEQIPLESVKYIAGDEEGDDASPPDGAAGAPPSTTSSESGVSPEDPEPTSPPPGSTSEETSPSSSGSPG